MTTIVGLLIFALIASIVNYKRNLNVSTNAALTNVNGLTGSYFNNSNFISLVSTRVDPTINFNWGYNSPMNSIEADSFSIRWSGYVKPRYSETYTFYINVDDGVRLWINNQLLIDKWFQQAATEYSGQIPLTANQLYQIKLEYYDEVQAAVIEMRWSSNSQSKEIVPSSQLFTLSQSSAYNKSKGDLNGDGRVDLIDLSILSAKWGTADLTADIDGNGRVDIVELSILANNWGLTITSPTTVVATPTPTNILVNTPTPTNSAILNTFPSQSGKKFFKIPATGDISKLPSGAECAQRIRRTTWEPRPNNKIPNTTKPEPFTLKPWGGVANSDSYGYDRRANSIIQPRIDGNFLPPDSTTDEILQWAACKWGFDEDIARAQAIKESIWYQNTYGDYVPLTSTSPAWYYELYNAKDSSGSYLYRNKTWFKAIEAEVQRKRNAGATNILPESFSLLQIKHRFHQGLGNSITSTAYSADYTYGLWRACYEGWVTYFGDRADTTWKADIANRNASASADDKIMWGCIGSWFSGGWFDSGANNYISNTHPDGGVKEILSERRWEKSYFPCVMEQGKSNSCKIDPVLGY
jgi:hypothetical protein